jgi:hypothetical protein
VGYEKRQRMAAWNLRQEKLEEKEPAAGSHVLLFFNLTKTIWRLVSIFH